MLKQGIFFNVCISMKVTDTFEATDAAHCSEDGGLHFHIPHSGIISFLQILQFFIMREGTDGPIESALTYRDGTGFFGTSLPNSLGATCM